MWLLDAWASSFGSSDMHETVAKAIFVVLSTINVTWFVTSVVIEILTALDDGEGTFFREKSLFGIDLGDLTKFESGSKRFLIPYLIMECPVSMEDFFLGWLIGSIFFIVFFGIAFLVSIFWPVIAILGSAYLVFYVTFLGMRRVIRSRKAKIEKRED
jgi:hypothetical protein